MNDNSTLREGLQASLAALPIRDLPGNGASFPLTADEAATRLRTLRADASWVRRYFAGDAAVIAEYDELVGTANGAPVAPRPVTANGSPRIPAAPKTADDMRREAELRYEGPIPTEVLAAISATEQTERDARAMAGMSDAERRRYRAAKEFRLAKRAFRLLCSMTRRGTVRRPDAAWFALRDRARDEAEAHIEAWRSLRWRERKGVA